jgi:hypothetical protein
MRAMRLTAAILGAIVPMAGCQQQVADLPVAVAASLPAPDAQPAGDQPATKATPTESGPIDVTWEQLDVGIGAESVYEPWMMKTSIKALDGQQVRITGYMHGGVAVKEGIREFVLLKNSDCPFGRQGEAHHAMVATLQGKSRASYSPQPLVVEGTFHVRPMNGPDGTTWALYAIDVTSVTLAAGESSPGNQTGDKQEDRDTP